MIRSTFVTALSLLITMPSLVQAVETPTTYSGLVSLVIDFINTLLVASFAIVFVVLIWKIIDAWILHADDPSKREEGRRIAVTALIVLVVVLSLWGIVNLIRTSFLGIV